MASRRSDQAMDHSHSPHGAAMSLASTHLRMAGTGDDGTPHARGRRGRWDIPPSHHHDAHAPSAMYQPTLSLPRQLNQHERDDKSNVTLLDRMRMHDLHDWISKSNYHPSSTNTPTTTKQPASSQPPHTTNQPASSQPPHVTNTADEYACV